MTEPVDLPEGAKSYVAKILVESALDREGGPLLHVPDAVRTALNTLLITLDDLEDEVSENQQKIEKLRSHLLKYGEHNHQCRHRDSTETACPCGLLNVLSE